VTRDPLDNLRDPALGELFRQLTSVPTPDELAGERAALAMFSSISRVQVELAPQQAPEPPRRRRSRAGGRLVAAGANVALIGGFAAAAYAQALPAPLQRVAHQILGFAGVPNSPESGARHGITVTSPATRHRGRGSASPAPRSSAPSPHPTGPSASSHPKPSKSPSKSPSSSPSPRRSSPSPSPSAGPPKLTITTAQSQITAGDSIQFTASLTDGGHPAGGAELSLSERAAGQTSWQVVAQAATGPRGRAVFVVSSLTTNASFRATEPGQVTSGELRIVVIPPISVSVASGSKRHSDQLQVAAPLAQSGDVVQLESDASGQWQVVTSHRLHKDGQTAFTVVARKISVDYRVVLLATAKHGASVSNTVTIAAKNAAAPRRAGTLTGREVTG
jgi:hypothetical protein